MANEEHLARLKEGVKIWNAWRITSPEIQPDLDGAHLYMAALDRVDLNGARLERVNLYRAHLDEANLRGAHLDGANLRGAHLSGVDLTGADLDGVDLDGANLRGAHLERANLRCAHLSEAYLTGANLQGAHLKGSHLRRAHLGAANLQGVDLSGADPSGVYLRGAHLTGADLSAASLHDATMGGTILGNVDLSKARELETVQHEGPSTIGIDTLYLSQGNIPELFLRGAGVPDEMITYIKSLVGRPFEFYSCFISYNHTDQSFARRLHNQLQGRGIRCWLDEHQMLPGDDIYEGIDRGIRFWDKVLLCCSQASLTS
jgi:uncharacterized protein YjbI with pentapeptide repeats